MKIVWDEPKRQGNIRDHGLDFADAEERFEWDDAIIRETYPSRHGGRRLKAIGFLDGNLVALVFAPLGSEALSFISLRPASRKERNAYDQSQETPRS
jgi:uncharacterized DUF497 family protein